MRSDLFLTDHLLSAVERAEQAGRLAARDAADLAALRARWRVEYERSRVAPVLSDPARPPVKIAVPADGPGDAVPLGRWCGLLGRCGGVVTLAVTILNVWTLGWPGVVYGASAGLAATGFVIWGATIADRWRWRIAVLPPRDRCEFGGHKLGTRSGYTRCRAHANVPASSPPMRAPPPPRAPSQHYHD